MKVGGDSGIWMNWDEVGWILRISGRWMNWDERG
jgi:hypothetical protein